jgi:hypothetical protein
VRAASDLTADAADECRDAPLHLRADGVEPGPPAARRLPRPVVPHAVRQHYEGAVLILPPVLLDHRLQFQDLGFDDVLMLWALCTCLEATRCRHRKLSSSQTPPPALL